MFSCQLPLIKRVSHVADKHKSGLHHKKKSTKEMLLQQAEAKRKQLAEVKASQEGQVGLHAYT